MRLSIKNLMIILGLFSIAITSAAVAQQEKSERKPSFNFSIADAPSIEEAGGPLFKRVKEAFSAANQGDGSAFKSYLVPNADLKLSYFVDSKILKTPFTAATVRAATKSCLGPYYFDEAAGWVQLSWVCRVDQDAPLQKYLTFRNSSELSLTVWFDNGRIREIIASEPLPVPMQRFVPMNAYEQLGGAK